MREIIEISAKWHERLMKEKTQATNVTEFRTQVISFNFCLLTWIIFVLTDECIQGKGNIS